MSNIHLIIGDTQVKPDVPVDHLEWIGKYILEIMPDVIVHVGDHADMPSLSSYDKGKKAMEGRRVQDDIDAANDAFTLLNAPLHDYNLKCRIQKKKQYNPRKLITLGNHEYRINRHVEANPNLEGLLSTDNLNYREHGWEVFEFLQIATVDGVNYCHYFANPMTGKPYSGMMETRLKNIGFSFTQGHQQGKKTGERFLGTGEMQRGLVLGSTYLHDEEYMGLQGNHYWRGIIVKHEVGNGNYDLMEVSLDFLCRKYEQINLHSFMKEKYNIDWGNRGR